MTDPLENEVKRLKERADRHGERLDYLEKNSHRLTALEVQVSSLKENFVDLQSQSRKHAEDLQEDIKTLSLKVDTKFDETSRRVDESTKALGRLAELVAPVVASTNPRIPTRNNDKLVVWVVKNQSRVILVLILIIAGLVGFNVRDLAALLGL